LAYRGCLSAFSDYPLKHPNLNVANPKFRPFEFNHSSILAQIILELPVKNQKLKSFCPFRSHMTHRLITLLVFLLLMGSSFDLTLTFDLRCVRSSPSGYHYALTPAYHSKSSSPASLQSNHILADFRLTST
jgi:hypothetical protein